MSDEVLERRGRSVPLYCEPSPHLQVYFHPAASVVAATILNHGEATSCQLMSQEAPVNSVGTTSPSIPQMPPAP